MKIKKEKKKILLATSVIAIIAGFLAYFLYIYPSLKQHDESTSTATDEQITEGERIQEKSSDKKTAPIGSDDNPGISPVNPHQESTQEDQKTTIASYITAKNQTDSQVQIRININGLITDGTCSLTLQKDDSIVTDKVGTAVFANSSTCEGFNVPLQNLSSGRWNIRVDIESSSFKSIINDTLDVR